jgi:heme A synthase
MNRFRPHHALALVPVLLLLVGAPLVNGVPGYVLGLPVMLAWIVGCVVLSSILMAILAALDRGSRSNRRDAEDR